MKALLGYKVGMTQIIQEDGKAVPVTIVQAGPCFVTQVKTNSSDGYDAVQIGFDETKERRLTRGDARASARFAEFGPFYTGMVGDLDEVLDAAGVPGD